MTAPTAPFGGGAAPTAPFGGGSAPTLVVLVVPPGPLGGVRDALTDWSALGLVSPFVWVDSEATGDQSIQGTQVVSGRSEQLWLAHGLAQRRYARIRVCVLVPAFAASATVSDQIEDAVDRLVRHSSGTAPVERLRCTVYRPGSKPGTGQPSREGWHNLVLSPEDSQGPGLGHLVLPPSTDAIDIGPYAAAALCGLVGLWARVNEAPLDGVSPLPGRNVLVVRSFYRKLDAGAVEAQVREGVTSTRAGLPLPRSGNMRSEYLPDVSSATGQVAERFWQRHPEVFNSGREDLPSTPVRRIGAMEAIAMFCGFLWATMRNAPGRWYATVVHRASLQVAAKLQRAMFGDVPAVAVVVNGVGADGQPADWQDLSAASAQLGDAVRAQGVIVQQGADLLTDVWRDYAAGAMTLADAGDRVEGLGPIQTNANRAVARDAADIVPGPQDRFTELPPGLRTADDRPLSPVDTLGVRQLRARLVAAAERGDSGLAADQALAALDRWRMRYQHAYAVRVGEHLAGAVEHLAGEVRYLLHALEEAGRQPVVDSALERKQRRLALMMTILFVLLLAAVAVLVVLGVRDVIETREAVIGGVVALAIWLGSTFGLFIAQQRNLFAELHRRRTAASQTEVNERNLARAIADLRRATQAYGQFLEWSAALSVVLNKPFGEIPAGRVDAELVGLGMPLATRLGIAEPTAEAVVEAVRQLRQDHYRFGWLSGSWNAVLADAHRRIGDDDFRDPQRLYGERSGSSFALTPWVRSLTEQGTGPGAGAAMWGEVLGSAQRVVNDGRGQGLLSRVRTAGSGPTPAGGDLVELSEFMAGIGDERPTGVQQFADEVFSASARIAGRTAVTSTWARRHGDGGLGQVAVTVQLSDGFPVYDLAWTPAGSAGLDRKPEVEVPYDGPDI